MKYSPLLILPLVGLLAGCETLQTPEQRKQQNAREQAASRMLEEKIYRLQAKVDSVEMENARLMSEMQQVQNDMRSLHSQISQLGSGIQHLDAQRARDKQEVIAQVSSRVEKVIKSQPNSQPTRKSGREHTVQSGHTLSAIAQAYGTTVPAIKKANNLKSDTIRVGQKLFIPE